MRIESVKRLLVRGPNWVGDAIMGEPALSALRGLFPTAEITLLVKPTIARWFPPETVAANPPHLDKVRAMIRSTPVDGFIGCAAALADHDFRSAVGSLTRPALFLVGEKDGTTPVTMRQMHQALPGSAFVGLEGAGHISNLDRPAEFTRAITQFLGGP